MSTIKSSDEHLTLNADGTSKDIKFQANGVEKASISSSGAFTSTSVNTGTIEADDKVTISYEAGSSDWELESTSGDDFTISRNSQQRLILDGSNGKLGMGIATPLQTLHLKQTARYTDIGLETTNRKYTVGVDNTTSEWYVYDDNATSFRMKIDSAGAVTMPSQPAFLVTKTSTSSNSATNTDHHVLFNNEVYDQNSDYASNTFTAPVSGKYYLTASLRLDNFDSGANYYLLGIVASNRTFREIWNPDVGQDGDYWTLQVSGLMDMDANDTAIVRFNQSAGNTQTHQDGNPEMSYFCGYLVC